MKTLLEDYQRKLATAEELIKTTKDTGSRNDIAKMARLNTKASEYRAFIVDIERAIKREEGEAEPKKRLEKLEAMTFADLMALKDLCEDKMAYQQRRFPREKKRHSDIYKEQYDIWIEWHSLNTAVLFVLDEKIKELNQKS